MKLGKLNLEIISDGYYSFDGGAMFGAVPKTIWGKITEPDNNNRILLGLNSLLIQDGRENILIDAGMGDKFTDKLKQIYALDHSRDIVSSLTPFCSPQDIDYVIFTHLHLDHCGGSSFYNSNGQLELTFPNAHYIVQKSEWELALNPDDKSRPSYLKENIQPLADSGRLRLVEGSYRFNDNIELILTAGHTTGHQAVKITSEGQTAFFGGDLFPTSHHVKPNYLTAIDLDPVHTLEQKKEFLKAAANEGWLVIWEHNPKRTITKIGKEGNKFYLIKI